MCGCEDVKTIRVVVMKRGCEDVKMICVDVNMNNMRRCEDFKMDSRHPLSEEPFARPLSGKTERQESLSPCLPLAEGMGGRHQQKEGRCFLADWNESFYSNPCSLGG